MVTPNKSEIEWNEVKKARNAFKEFQLNFHFSARGEKDKNKKSRVEEMSFDRCVDGWVGLYVCAYVI